MLGQTALEVTLDGKAAPADRLRVTAPTPLPLQNLLTGLTPAEAAERTSLIFNICGTAQQAAVGAALGLPSSFDAPKAILREALRDHAVMLAATWPAALGWPADHAALRGVADLANGGGQCLRRALLAAESLPADLPAFAAWLDEGASTPARALAVVRDTFKAEWGAVWLPLWSGETATGAAFDVNDLDLRAATWRGLAFETGLTARHAAHPLMQAIESEWGRSVLWRLTARLVDLAEGLDALDGIVAPRTARPLGPGIGLAPAARGAMLVEGRLEGGRVAALSRLSPTDVALHPDGLLNRALATLHAVPFDRLHDVTQLTLAAVDPCLPYKLVVTTPGSGTTEEVEDVHRLRMLG